MSSKASLILSIGSVIWASESRPSWSWGREDFPPSSSWWARCFSCFCVNVDGSVLMICFRLLAPDGLICLLDWVMDLSLPLIYFLLLLFMSPGLAELCETEFDEFWDADLETVFYSCMIASFLVVLRAFFETELLFLPPPFKFFDEFFRLELEKLFLDALVEGALLARSASYLAFFSASSWAFFSFYSRMRSLLA